MLAVSVAVVVIRSLNGPTRPAIVDVFLHREQAVACSVDFIRQESSRTGIPLPSHDTDEKLIEEWRSTLYELNLTNDTKGARFVDFYMRTVKDKYP